MNLTRQQLASVFRDPQMVRAFESLFERSEVVIPEGIDQAVQLAGDADEKAQQSADALAALGSQRMALLPDDVTASSDVLIDATGLFLPVEIGRPVSFEATLFYDADSSATGSRWSVSGPTAAYLAYASEWALSNTSTTQGNYSVYDQPSTANASSANASGNVAFIRGMLLASDEGNLQIRFAAETGGTITIKAGSFLTLRNLY